MRTKRTSRAGMIVGVAAVAVIIIIILAAPPADAGEFYFGYRGGGGYFVPPPPVYRQPHYRPPQWGGGCGQSYYPAPQQWGPPPGYGYGYNPPPPPDTYRSTTTCRGNSCWQDTSSTWRTPGGGRIRVNQSGPVAPPWELQVYHW